MCDTPEGFDERPFTWFMSRYSLEGFCPPGYQQLGSTWRIYDSRAGKVVADCTSYGSAVAAWRLLSHDEWKDYV